MADHLDQDQDRDRRTSVASRAETLLVHLVRLGREVVKAVGRVKLGTAERGWSGVEKVDAERPATRSFADVVVGAAGTAGVG
jgi:hypothetical protein